MKKKLLVLISIVVAIITIIIIATTYALFESNIEGNVIVKTARWSILINNTDISSGNTKNFVIDGINLNGSNHTKDGKIAPGESGSFDILIDPTDTNVSIRYDVLFDLSNLEGTKISIVSIEETEEGKKLIKTGENLYTGIIELDKIKQGVKNNITVNLVWNEDETTNEEDTEMGSIANNTIQIPVSITVTQYLGEEIVGIE